MRLLSLTLNNFKNLNNVSIDFNDGSPLEAAITTVILGHNGTGKSNLLQALIFIFRDLDLGRSPAFSYQLNYLCRDSEIFIDADPERSGRDQVRIKIDGADIKYANFYKHPERRFLPSYVFGYYSGPSNRMETHFDLHQKRFYNALIHDDDQPLRPLLYARVVHSQFALLSFFNEQDPSILEFLGEHLGIQGMDSVLFVMRKPSWTSKEGDPRFWNARGAVQQFLDRLYSLALAPMRLPRRVSVDFKGSTTLEHLYLYLKDHSDLKALSDIYPTQQEFFKALESTYISEILSEVRIRVKVRNADGSLTFRDLSEGEQQLLMVLGLLRFTKEDEALFLLDEPDTHLNPAWGIQYLEFLKKVVGAQKSHIVISTHNPLVISSLDRGQVRIMQRNNKSGEITVQTPYESPRGLGVDGILTSDLFGLRSALDIPTQHLVDERRELAVKDVLSPQEEERLAQLNEQLSDIDFSIGTRDIDYARFIKEKTTREDAAIRQQVVLTPEQQEEQRRLMLEILDELEEGEKDA